MKHIVFFDFDGVIVDTYSFCYRIVESREYITEADYRRRFEGNIFDAERRFKSPDTTMGDFTRQYIPELMKCRPVKEVAFAIHALAERYSLVIVSSTETSPIADYLKAVGLRECFADILGSDVDKSKVNKINGVLRRYALDPAQTVFITDTLGDMREAERCGVKCIGIAGGYHSRETLQKGAPLIITDSGHEIIQAVDSYFDTGKL